MSPPDPQRRVVDLGHARKEAERTFHDLTQQLKSAVQEAATTETSEVALARAAQVDRMTIRSWLGRSRSRRRSGT